MNSLEKQQELHNLPQYVLQRSTIPEAIYRSDIVNGVQTIQSAHESFIFHHGLPQQQYGIPFTTSIQPQPIGFKTYGLPIHNNAPHETIFVNRPEFAVAPSVIPSLPSTFIHNPSFPMASLNPTFPVFSTMPNRPTLNAPPTDALVINHPFDTDSSFPSHDTPSIFNVAASPPQFVSPSILPIGPSPIDSIANFEPINNVPSIQPVLSLTPPLDTALPSSAPLFINSPSIDSHPAFTSDMTFAPSFDTSLPSGSSPIFNAENVHSHPERQPATNLPTPSGKPLPTVVPATSIELPEARPTTTNNFAPSSSTSPSSSKPLTATEAPPLIHVVDNAETFARFGHSHTPSTQSVKSSTKIGGAERIPTGDIHLYDNQYTAPDGTVVSESAQIFSTADGWENVVGKHGSYKYTSPEGIPIEVRWIADQRGFRILN